MSSVDISKLLPPSLLLPPRLSAHKYLMVCTLTVAAWDTLVLSPRTWRLMKTKEWPLLKITYHILRYLMPIEFIIVAVAFFDTGFSASQCSKFYLFEPIMTAILMTVTSASLAVRLYAIFDKSKAVMGALGALLFLQVVAQAICCGFYKVVPLKEGQGCIAGPKENWVGVYWLAPTLFYTATLGLAVLRSTRSQMVKPISLWKLFLRDGLNLYAAIWLVNMINVLFWFIVNPTDESDSIKTIITSMTAVLTTTMTLRVILGVRGSLAQGGMYSGGSASATNHSASGTGSATATSKSAHVPASRLGNTIGISRSVQQSTGVVNANDNSTYTIEQMRAKAERDWIDNGSDGDADSKSGYVVDDTTTTRPSGFREKASLDDEEDDNSHRNNGGIKVTIDRQYQ
ncbi:hypothetical protein FRC03_004898 [Tulasnella sp. 419]|nr:hypothetical protein FRC03_004898 [Tulasnella sp. 419]